MRDRARLEGLWARILDGSIDCITSDHSPCPTEEKARGNDNIWQAWGGITGIQSLVVSVLTEGRKRGLSLERAAELLATNPAKIAGLWPRKGEVRVGSDADLILVDLERHWILKLELLLSKHQHSPYVGFESAVLIKQVLLRGQVVNRDATVIGSPSGGWLR